MSAIQAGVLPDIAYAMKTTSINYMYVYPSYIEKATYIVNWIFVVNESISCLQNISALPNIVMVQYWDFIHTINQIMSTS